MVRYENRGGDSGITAYELHDGAIIVEFKGGAAYLYDSQSPGPEEVAEMQRLAISGEGLNEYISKYIRKRYKAKIR